MKFVVIFFIASIALVTAQIQYSDEIGDHQYYRGKRIPEIDEVGDHQFIQGPFANVFRAMTKVISRPSKNVETFVSSSDINSKKILEEPKTN